MLAETGNFLGLTRSSHTFDIGAIKCNYTDIIVFNFVACCDTFFLSWDKNIKAHLSYILTESKPCLSLDAGAKCFESEGFT